jgi:hypothetical protein
VVIYISSLKSSGRFKTEEKVCSNFKGNNFNCEIFMKITNEINPHRVMVERISRWHLTAKDRVRYSKSVDVGFVADKVVCGHVLLQRLQFPLSTSFQKYTVLIHSSKILYVLASDGVVKQQ